TFRASDLKGWGTAKWLTDFLADPAVPRFFGHTQFKEGTMVGWVDEQKAPAKKAFPLIAAWLGTHPRQPPKKTDPKPIQDGFAAYQLRCLRCHTFAGMGGTTESSLGPDFTGYGDADWLRLMITDPHDMLRYGRKPKAGAVVHNVMPLFRDKESVAWPGVEEQLERTRRGLLSGWLKDEPPPNDPTADAVKKHNAEVRAQVQANLTVLHLTDVQRELIIRWMRGDERVVFGGSKITGPKR